MCQTASATHPVSPLTCIQMASSTAKKIVSEIPTWIRVYDDGTVERPRSFPLVPPSLDDPITGVSSKDIIISQNTILSARLYLPKLDNDKVKLPIYIYFHGGGFFFESAFSKLYNDHLNKLLSLTNFIAVSIEYRLAPEHPLPACYYDCWDALQWVASHASKNTTNTEPWLTDHGDFDKVFIGGDSAGGNIAHNIAMRAGLESLPCGVTIAGAILSHPYFWGSQPIGSETVTNMEQNVNRLIWKLVYPCAPGGIDNPMINPMGPGAPSLAGLGCSKILVFVAGKDDLRDRGLCYYEAVNKSGWQGKIQLFEDKDENHVFYLFNSESDTATQLIKRMASFLLN